MRFAYYNTTMAADNPYSIPADWPQPDRAAIAHSQALLDIIKADIDEQGGLIDFAQYMQHALYAPALGYYTAGANKFGVAGDFVTAPEISPLFGRCLARQCQQALAQIAGGAILEVGAGSGKLARDILIELNALDSLPVRYFILESSADLRQRQQALLKDSVADFFDCIEWLDALPSSFSGVVVANELLDALPLHRLIYHDGGFGELAVVVENGALQWRKIRGETRASVALQQRLAGIDAVFGDGYTAELCLAMAAWLASLSAGLDQALVLLIDYGSARHEYYHPQRVDGSLRCHYRHRAHDDPFVYPGLQDITAHVDFTAVAEAALENQLDVMGYTTQAYFLLSCGLAEMTTGANSSTVDRLEWAQQVRRLTLPGEMGESFKVIALGRGLDTALQGFAMRDLRGRL